MPYEIIFFAILGTVVLLMVLSFYAGRKVTNLDWEEAITFTDHPDEVKRMMERGRRKMNDHYDILDLQ